MIVRPLQPQPSPRRHRVRDDRDPESPRPRRWQVVDVSDVVARSSRRSRGRFEGY